MLVFIKIHNRVNRQPMELQETFVSHLSDKGLLSRIYKEQLK